MSEEIQQGEGLSTLMKVVCFIIPLVGLILYFMKKSDEPAKSSDAGKFGLYGLVFGIALNVIMSLMS